MNTKSPLNFSPEEELEIVEAIRTAEESTSGEIRIHIDSNSSNNHFKKSIDVFNALKMNETKERNAILFHISERDHNFTIIGDVGIDSVISHGFWERVKQEVISEFKQKSYKRGLIKGILMVGDALKIYFPQEGGNSNELSNEISRC